MLKYARKLNDKKTISINKWRKLTPEDIAVPGGIKPTEWQWEEYLNRKQGKARPAEEVFAEIKKKLKDKFGE